MKNEILDYIINKETHKPIPGRCVESHLIKKGYYDYIISLYNDSESLRESLFRMRNNIVERPVCKMCGKPVNFLNTSFSQYCSKYCQNNDPIVLKKNKENVSKALKNAYKERGEEIKEKRKNTLYDKYGVETNSPFGITYFNKKAKNTFNERINDGSLVLDKSKNKEYSRNYCINNWKSKGINITYKNDTDKVVIVHEYCKIHSEFEIPIYLLNGRYERNINLCTICKSTEISKSSIEVFVKDILDEYNVSYIMNTRKVLPSKKELDFYIENKNIAIECNGIFWHSELRNSDKSYHLNKTKECNDLNISLIHLWEDEIIEKPDIVKSMLLNKLGLTTNKIYARNCIVKEITSLEYSVFLNKNHIQGSTNSKIKLGLFYNNELSAVMGLGSLRIALGQKSKHNVYELHRYAVKLNTSVIGGASKIFKYFINNYHYAEIVSYARRDYSMGNLYEKLGFELISYTEPNYFWVNKEGKRENRYKYRKSELPKIFGDINMNKTEVEIMHENGFYRIWDCGSIKYKYINQ